MSRILSLILFCLTLAACNKSDDTTSRTDDVDNSLNPAAMAVDPPPTNAKLPADLRPPA